MADEGVRDGSSAAAVQHRSSRSPDTLRAGLAAWMAATLPAGADPHLGSVSGTTANGQSSETVVFEIAWTDGDTRQHERLVARLAPAAADVPVFPTYDLGLQHDVIAMVGARSAVPVPRLFGHEPDPGPLGTPFFVMSHVEGLIPPDVMPYTFGDNWLADAGDDDRSTLQRSMVRALVDLHAVDGDPTVMDRLAPAGPGASVLARRVDQARAWYRYAAADCGRSPLIERGFAWLDAHWPADPGPTVLSWGDARIGNVIFRDFRPVALLDWEMVTQGPRELDLGWLLYSHRIFQDFAELFELPGLPHFLRIDDVAGEYARLSGHEPRHLDFHMAFAALQWAIVFLRIGSRQMHFGELDPPGEVDDLLRNRDSLEAILSGETV